MNPPGLVARRFLAACLWGCVLGLYYGFLRPLRRKHHWPADLLFVPGLFYVWLVVMFQVCQGDLRFGYTCGIFLGWFLWEQTVGRLLRPVFSGFWAFVIRLLGWILLPFRKIFKKIYKIAKKLFALEKKWGTIKYQHRKRPRYEQGGVSHGQSPQSLFPDPAGVKVGVTI